MLRHEKALQDYVQSHIEEQARLRKGTKQIEATNKEDRQLHKQASNQPFAWLRRLITSR